MLLLCFPTLISAQSRSIFRLIEIRTDSAVYNSNKHYVFAENEKQLYFQYDHEQETAEFTLLPDHQNNLLQLHLIPSSDYELVDTFLLYDNAWHGKVRFRETVLHGIIITTSAIAIRGKSV